MIGKGALAFAAIVLVIASSGCLGWGSAAANTVSADNVLGNYAWFKTQETAMQQLLAQVCAANAQITQFKHDYGDPKTYSSTVNDQYGQLTFVKQGYISKYNSLVSDYNARRSNFIKSLGRDQTPPPEYTPFYDSQC